MNYNPHALSDEALEAVLIDFIENRLPAEQMESMRRHILMCDECHEAVTDLIHFEEQVIPALQQSPQPSLDFQQRLLKAIQTERDLASSAPALPQPHKPSSFSFKAAVSRLHWPQRSIRRYSALAAAAGVILVAVTLMNQPAIRALLWGQSGSQSVRVQNGAAPEVAEKSVIAADSVTGVESGVESAAEPEMATAPQARILMMAPEPTGIYQDLLASGNTIAVRDKTTPDKPLTALDLTPSASVAILLETDLYIAAIPTNLLDADFTRLEQWIPQLEPSCRILIESEHVLTERLNNRLEPEVVMEIMTLLEHPAVSYLVLEVGGH